MARERRLLVRPVVWPLMRRPVWPLMRRPMGPLMRRPVGPLMRRLVWPVMRRPVWPMMRQPVWLASRQPPAARLGELPRRGPDLGRTSGWLAMRGATRGALEFAEHGRLAMRARDAGDNRVRGGTPRRPPPWRRRPGAAAWRPPPATPSRRRRLAPAARRSPWRRRLAPAASPPGRRRLAPAAAAPSPAASCLRTAGAVRRTGAVAGRQLRRYRVGRRATERAGEPPRGGRDRSLAANARDPARRLCAQDAARCIQHRRGAPQGPSAQGRPRWPGRGARRGHIAMWPH